MARLRETVFELLDNAVENGPFEDYGFRTPEDVVFDLQGYDDELADEPESHIRVYVVEWLSERGIKL